MKRSELKQIIREVIEEGFVQEASDYSSSQKAIDSIASLPLDTQLKKTASRAKAIKEGEKAWRSFEMARTAGLDKQVQEIYLERAAELGHIRAIQQKDSREIEKARSEANTIAANRAKELSDEISARGKLTSAENKDEDRLWAIAQDESKYRQGNKAQSIADRITNPDKAWSRYKTALRLSRGDLKGKLAQDVVNVFLRKAKDLGHPEAVDEYEKLLGAPSRVASELSSKGRETAKAKLIETIKNYLDSKSFDYSVTPGDRYDNKTNIKIYTGDDKPKYIALKGFLRKYAPQSRIQGDFSEDYITLKVQNPS